MKEQPSIDDDNNNKNNYLLIKRKSLVSEDEDEKAVLNENENKDNIKEIPQSKNIQDIK